MPRIPRTAPAGGDPLTLIERLARAHHRLALFEAEIQRLAGSELTSPQARVIFCLGGTEGLTCNQITERTLITKGTLTGVLDRLENKGLVRRWGDTDDGRRIIVDLTRLGERVYAREYPRYAGAMKERLAGLGARERSDATQLLERIAELF